MDELHLKQRIKMTTDSTGLLLIGCDAAAAMVAANRNTPVVLIPFALATLASFGAIWWAHVPMANSPPPRHLAQKKSRRIALTHSRQNQ